MNRPIILVTGGTGFIGSHAVVCLLQNGFSCVVIDNLSNSDISVLDKIKSILPDDVSEYLFFHQVDITDKDELEKVIQQYSLDACIHFAGLKAVGESVKEPLKYYHNNVEGTLNLVNLLQKYECYNLIFSSSATVYGNHAKDPNRMVETDRLGAENPYGRTKWMIEHLLRDVFTSEPNKWRIDVLRYFNPIGAHESGLIGENPNGIPNNLFPYIMQVLEGKRDKLRIFGDTYLTEDGTGVRDYIHVMDLVEGHIASLRNILEEDTEEDDDDETRSLNKKQERFDGHFREFNLGTGEGTSVLDMVRLVEEVSGKEIPYSICSVRDGDVACCVCNPDKAWEVLGWKTNRSVKDAIRDGINFSLKL